MGPDWSIADSDEFEEMDNNAEEEAIENSEIYEGQNLKRIFAPHSIVNGESFANKIKVKSVVSSQDLDESVHHEEECDKEYRSLEEDFAEPNEKKEVKKKEDFEGTFTRDPNSKFRKMVQRVKSTQSDPTMKGKILARTGGKRVPFCADTGCSVNILPAKLAAARGLKWMDLDRDESTYKSVTNEDKRK